MKVKQLREVIANIPDDAEVLQPSSDHSYVKVQGAAFIEVNRGKGRRRGEWWEFWGPTGQLPDAESDVIEALVMDE